MVQVQVVCVFFFRDNLNSPVCSPSFTLYLKSLLTPDVHIETCESLDTSLASLASSHHSDSPRLEAQTLEQIDALTGVRRRSRAQTHAAAVLWGC